MKSAFENMALFSTTLLSCLVIASAIALIELPIDTFCNRNYPPNCDSTTMTRMCRFYKQREIGKCTQIVFDPNQDSIITKCFLDMLNKAQSTLLVRSSNGILKQNIYNFDDDLGTNTNTSYKSCRSVVVLSDDSDLWLNWLIGRASMYDKRFYPFNHIFIVSQTRPELMGNHYDYMYIHLLQLFWIQVKIESKENAVNLLRFNQIQHIPTKLQLNLDTNGTEIFENDLNMILQAGSSKSWKSFHYTRTFRASQITCVPYVIPIYNQNGTILR